MDFLFTQVINPYDLNLKLVTVVRIGEMFGMTVLTIAADLKLKIYQPPIVQLTKLSLMNT